LSSSRNLQEYRKQVVNGASPLQLVIMLYDGALRFMDAGRRAMEERNIDAQNTNLQKAQKIVLELASCLDMRQGGEIAENLFALYTYCYNQLVAANIEDDPALIDQATRVLSDLRESWVQLEANLQPVGVPDAA
jgi:flagellar protein FliS